MLPRMEELWINDLFVIFDGTILEMFGFIMTAKTETGARYHVRNLQIDVEGPDRKGRRKLRFNLARSANFGVLTEVVGGRLGRPSGPSSTG